MMLKERSKISLIKAFKWSIMFQYRMVTSQEKNSRSKERAAGFTIIEAMAAALILLVGLVTIAQLFAVATANFAFARSQSLALPAAQLQMERLIAQYRMGVTLTSSTTPITISYTNPNDSRPINRFAVSWTVTPLARGTLGVQVTAVPLRYDDGSLLDNTKVTLNKVVILRTILTPIKS